MTTGRLFGVVMGLSVVTGAIAPARAERLVVALSNHRVLINSSFTGVDLVLFGSVEHEGVMRRRGYDLVATVTEPQGSDPYRTAFLDINRAHGLYRELPDAVVFLTADLFRAAIALPANVPVGTYDVDVKLFADGLLLAQQRTALETAKVGFEQFVASAAREHGVLYGVATVMLAILTGWFGAVVFRRDFN